MFTFTRTGTVVAILQKTQLHRLAPAKVARTGTAGFMGLPAAAHIGGDSGVDLIVAGENHIDQPVICGRYVVQECRTNKCNE